MAVVFRITNLMTHKSLIGVTSKDALSGFRYWMNNCTKTKFSDYDIYKDYRKYNGKKDFEFVELQYLDNVGEAMEVADNYIDSENTLEPNGYNRGYVGIRKKRPDFYDKKKEDLVSVGNELSISDKTRLENEMISNYGLDGIVTSKLKKNYGTKETIEGLRKLANDLEKFGNIEALSVIPKQLNDELEKYGDGITELLKKRTNINSEKEYLVVPKDSILCLKCGKYKARELDFYVHLDRTVTYDGYIHFCKDCLEEYSESIYNICKNPIFVIMSLCQLVNIIFVQEVAEKASRLWTENKDIPKNISKYYFSDLKSVWAQRKDIPKSLLEFRHSNFVGDIFSFEVHNPLTPRVFIEELNQNLVEEKMVKDKNLTEGMEQKWGKGFKKEEYLQMEEEFSKLEKFLPKKTELHMDALKKYIVYSSKERKALADGRDLKEVKEWNALADKAAENAQLKIKQLSTDFGEGVNSFAQLAETVEEYYSVIPTLPKTRKMPYDDIDFLIWQNVNYIRRLEGKPEATYEDIYYFIDEELTKKMKDSGMTEEQITKAKDERNAIFKDLSDTYQEPLWLLPTMDEDEEDDNE